MSYGLFRRITTSAALMGALCAVSSVSAAVSAEAQWWNPFARPAAEPPKAAPTAAPAPSPAVAPAATAPGAVRQSPPAAAAPGFLAATPPAPAAPAPAAAAPPDASTRMERIEAQMRNLTGQIEQLNYQMVQLRDELRQLQVAAPPPVQANPRATEALPPGQRRVAADTNAADPIGNAIAAAPGRAPAAGTGNDGPINLAALAGAGPAGATPAAPATQTSPSAVPSPVAKLTNPRTDYDTAYRHILAGEYADAEKGLRAFLAAYPEDKLAADAEYWLAESLFERALYRDAAEEFVNGYKAFPKSPKAPDTLLKLALSLQNLGERDAACQTYAKLLKDYPTLGNTMVQRVRLEQKNATCQ